MRIWHFRACAGMALAWLAAAGLAADQAAASQIETGHFGSWSTAIKFEDNGAFRSCDLRFEDAEPGFYSSLVATFLRAGSTLVFYDSDWELSKDADYETTVKLDDREWTGLANAFSPQTIIMLFPAAVKFDKAFLTSNAIRIDMKERGWGIRFDANGVKALGRLSDCLKRYLPDSAKPKK